MSTQELRRCDDKDDENLDTPACCMLENFYRYLNWLSALLLQLSTFLLFVKFLYDFVLPWTFVSMFHMLLSVGYNCLMTVPFLYRQFLSLMFCWLVIGEIQSVTKKRAKAYIFRIAQLAEVEAKKLREQQRDALSVNFIQESRRLRTEKYLERQRKEKFETDKRLKIEQANDAYVTNYNFLSEEMLPVMTFGEILDASSQFLERVFQDAAAMAEAQRVIIEEYNYEGANPIDGQGFRSNWISLDSSLQNDQKSHCLSKRGNLIQ